MTHACGNCSSARNASLAYDCAVDIDVQECMCLGLSSAHAIMHVSRPSSGPLQQQQQQQHLPQQQQLQRPHHQASQRSVQIVLSPKRPPGQSAATNLPRQERLPTRSLSRADALPQERAIATGVLIAPSGLQVCLLMLIQAGTGKPMSASQLRYRLHGEYHYATHLSAFQHPTIKQIHL